jgi:hypothetical protein
MTITRAVGNDTIDEEEVKYGKTKENLDGKTE